MDGRKVGTMSHPRSEIEAEKLLGGYATGTLSEQEKTELFAAALEHQELFDALMDEEALRELLSDPKAHQQLLEVLEEPRVVPFWRRPAVLSVAAGLMLLVTTTLMIRRQPEVLNRISEKAADSSEVAKPAEAPLDRMTKKAEPKPVTPPSSLDLKAKADNRPAAEQAKEDKTSMANQSANRVAAVADAAPATPIKATLAEQAIAGGASSKAAPSPAMAPQAGSAAPSMAAVAESRAAYGAPAKSEKQRLAKKESADQRGALAPLDCKIVKLDKGRTRLTVTWDSLGYLYVLKRRGAAVSVLTPAKTTSTDSGLMQSVFEFAGDGVLDVYLLQTRCAQPESLPAEGPINGHRRRLEI